MQHDRPWDPAQDHEGSVFVRDRDHCVRDTRLREAASDDVGNGDEQFLWGVTTVNGEERPGTGGNDPRDVGWAVRIAGPSPGADSHPPSSAAMSPAACASAAAANSGSRTFCTWIVIQPGFSTIRFLALRAIRIVIPHPSSASRELSQFHYPGRRSGSASGPSPIEFLRV